MPHLRTRTFGVGALLLTFNVLNITTATAQALPPPFPAVNLPASIPPRAQLDLLSERQITDIASWYGWSKSQLVNEVRTNFGPMSSGLHFDVEGRLYVVGRSPGLPLSAPPQPRKDYPMGHLSSNPGASKTIYLNFDNASVIGSRWTSTRTLNLPGFSLDATAPGSPGGQYDRSQEEQAVIFDVYLRLRDLFSPFDVNITTEDPPPYKLRRDNAADQTYGTTVHIYTDRSGCACQTIRAYVKSFGERDESVNPILINTAFLGDATGGTDQAGRDIAKAAAHAIGHALGLRREMKPVDDPTVRGIYRLSSTPYWAPVMGAYDDPRVSTIGFSRNVEDNFEVLQKNGLKYRNDDHGGERFTASVAQMSYLPYGDVVSSLHGIIERSTDQDIFAVDVGFGTLRVEGFAGRSLNLKLELYDSNAKLIASSDPLDSAGADLSAQVAPGTHYIVVKPSGEREAASGYSSYGSRGNYVIGVRGAGTRNPGPTAALTTSAQVVVKGQPVTFDASGSTDDKPGLLYRWNLGNGTVRNFGPSPTITATYDKAGTFLAYLSVRDSAGYVSTTMKAVKVIDPASVPSPALKVDNPVISLSPSGSGFVATARALVRDSQGRPAPDVDVSGKWLGRSDAVVTARTDSSGLATFVSPASSGQACFLLSIQNATKPGFTYDTNLISAGAKCSTDVPVTLSSATQSN